MAYFYKPTIGSPLVFMATNKFGTKVILEKSRFDDHIIHPTFGHVELIGNEDVIKNTIENPRLIFQSAQFPTTWIYVGKGFNSINPKMDVATVVNHTSQEFGYITTSMLRGKGKVKTEGAKIIYDQETDEYKL